jgi:hypothetical protein
MYRSAHPQLDESLFVADFGWHLAAYCGRRTQVVHARLQP